MDHRLLPAIRRAGLPNTVIPLSTERATRLAMPIVARSPIVIPSVAVALGPIQTSLPTVTLPDRTAPAAMKVRAPTTTLRSEEHTSELQSLMRISYAVFCLNKNKKILE